jgi:4-amino-4-deoxy-L-arabinose transferase-like glycosyltransferase
MLLVFLVPFVLAFALALTGDMTVNHKWIMMSLMLVSMYAAIVLTNLLKSGDWLKRAVAVVLLVVLTATCVYDLTTVVKKNENYLIFSYDDPVTNWIAENATCDDVFLTPYYSLNNVVMGGAMLYYGWPYYAWSAGYDTYTRDTKVKKMYQASSVDELDEMIKENNIRYIIIDHDCRTSSEYKVREDVIEAAYEAVFEYDTNDWMVRIFDTTKEK